MDTNLLQDEEERQVVGTRCLSKAGLAEGTNANTIKIVTPNGAGIDYAIGNKLYHKADADNIAMTACDVQADLTSCLYLVSLNAAGTVTITKGEEKLTADLGQVWHLSLSQVYNILTRLESQGFITHSTEGRRYRLGVSLFELGA